MAKSEDDESAVLRREVAALRRERDGLPGAGALAERVAHQAATLDVLRAMSASPGDPQPVFDLIVRRARELCNGAAAALIEYDGRLAHFRAQANVLSFTSAAALDAYVRQYPMPLTRSLNSHRAMLDRQVIHVRDMAAEPEANEASRRLGFGSEVLVPMLRDGESIGVISMISAEKGGFSDAQVALVEIFAEQAVIAISSAATFRALEVRTGELAARNGAFEVQVSHQAATIDVLKVMSVLTGDAQPVFETILEQAMRLCGCMFGALAEFDGRLMHLRAKSGVFAETGAGYWQQFPMPPSRATGPGRAILDRRMEHVRDMQAHPEVTAAARALGTRSQVNIPLFRGDTVIGVINVSHQDVDAFTPAHIALLKTFAEQAVIAIGGAANYRALQARTAELQEALEHQTATAEVLGVINASQGNLVPVFEAMLDRAMRLCRAAFGILHTWDGVRRQVVATRGLPPAFAAHLAENPEPPTISPLSRQVIETGRPGQMLDTVEGAGYRAGHPGARAIVEFGGARTMLMVPLRQDGVVVGHFTFYRQEVRAFEAAEIGLMESFAAQAVIAMENARLLGALREQTAGLQEALEHQTATAEVLGVINASQGNLVPVFEAMLDRAMRLCRVAFGALYTWDGARRQVVAQLGLPPAYAAHLAATPDIEVSPLARQVVESGRPLHVLDTAESREYQTGHPRARAIVDLGGARTMLLVPLRQDGAVAGYFSLYRQEVRAFEAAEIGLMESFAAQAVIAMENARLLGALREQTAGLQEALEHQTATAEVLGVINASQGNLVPVFEAMLDRAMRLCRVAFGVLYTWDGKTHRAVASRGVPPVYAAYLAEHPDTATLPALAQEAFETGQPRHFLDAIEAPGYRAGHPSAHALVKLGRARSLLVVPLRQDDAGVGCFALYRQEVRAFEAREIALVESFAAQAVIAMENARLLGALREQTEALARRNSDFAERIDQQAATIDVLKVMSASADDTRPVFDQIVRRAVGLCEGHSSAVWEYDGELMHLRAICNPVGNSPEEIAASGPEGAAFVARFPAPPADIFFVGSAILERKTFIVSDWQLEEGFKSSLPSAGLRSSMVIPLLRDGEPVGVISLSSQRPGGFSESQRELMRIFAEQAVIAIGSVATFRALHDRTAELSRAVAEAQALEAVLRAVNSSLDLDTVLATIIAHAVPLAQADEGLIYAFDDAEQVFVPKAAFGMSEERVAALRERRIRIGEAFVGRSAAAREPVHMADVQTEGTAEERAFLQGIHAVLAVPLLRDDGVIGGLVIRRRREGGFAEATIALMQTFAAQSVLAIANARLFDEVQARTRELSEALETQSATADVLKAISRTAYDLDAVLTTLIETAVRLCDAAAGGTIYRKDGNVYRHAADQMNLAPAYRESERQQVIRAGRGTLIGRVAMERRTVQITDAWSDPDYEDKERARIGGVRSMLGVPLLRDGEVIGAFALASSEPVPFSPRQVALVTTFADQAVIAIENVRLFDDAERARAASEAALADLRRTQDRLVQTEKLASLGQLTAGIAHEIKNPLNFVNNFSDLSVDLLDELRDAVAPDRLAMADDVRAEIDDVTATLKGNLEKIAHHGRRADSIVKNMLQHSRSGDSEHRAVDINATVEEALNLAYHGARAERPGFNITLERALDPAAGMVELFPQEFTRVILNLCSNGFYAAHKRATTQPGFQPVLRLSTSSLGERVEVRVRDNGTGMTAAVRARIFEPFFTTKPTGEGTGLGLSLSHDIIVKQHAGQLSVDSQPDSHTEFTIILPRRMAAPGGAASQGALP